MSGCVFFTHPFVGFPIYKLKFLNALGTRRLVVLVELKLWFMGKKIMPNSFEKDKLVLDPGLWLLIHFRVHLVRTLLKLLDILVWWYFNDDGSRWLSLKLVSFIGFRFSILSFFGKFILMRTWPDWQHRFYGHPKYFSWY